MTEATIVVRLPRVLSELTDCDRRIPVVGETVAAALEDLVRQNPRLGIHLFDDTGCLRRHVLCFRNELAVQSRVSLAEPLAAGDHLTLVNSVAGG